jgi:hypothetical protein
VRPEKDDALKGGKVMEVIERLRRMGGVNNRERKEDVKWFPRMSIRVPQKSPLWRNNVMYSIPFEY